jgi:hypothetical protein
MLALMLVAGIRAHAGFTGTVLPGIFLAGFVAATAGLAVLYVRMLRVAR